MILQNVIVNGTAVIDGTLNTKNLQLWLDANNASSYPGTGTTVTDLSGNGYTHSLSSSAAQFTTVGGIKCFNCSQSGYAIINNSTTNPVLSNSGFTYNIWANMISSTATWRTLLRCYNYQHPLLIQTGTNELGMYDNATGTSFNDTGYSVASLAGVWTNWVITGTSSGETIYINGVKAGTSVSKSASGDIHYALGSTQQGNQPFGYIANCMLYNYVMPQWQIQQNFNSARRGFGV